MRPICALFCTLALLPVAISAAKSELRDQTKAAGVYKGRKPSIDAARIEALKASGLGLTEIARRLKIGRASVYRVVAQRVEVGTTGIFRSWSAALWAQTRRTAERVRVRTSGWANTVVCVGNITLRGRPACIKPGGHGGVSAHLIALTLCCPIRMSPVVVIHL